MSFGINGSTLTGSVRTDYLTTAALSDHVHGQYLTTAMASNDGTLFMGTSERANYFATAGNSFAQSTHSHGNPTLALTNLSGTTASGSNGLTLSISAPAGGGGADGYNVLAAGTQTATTAGTVLFENSNGISFGMSGSTRITASHNGLTTAAQSNHSHGVTLNLTNLNGTTGGNSQGINLSLSAIVPAQTVQTQGMVSFNGQTGALSLGVGSSLSSSVNGLSTTFGLASNITTALQSAGAYLTTAMASNEPHIRGIVGGTLTATSGTVTFTGTNGISVVNVGNEIRISLMDSHHVEGLALAGNGYGSGFSVMSSGTQTIHFSGDISASQNGNAFTISVPAQSVQTQNMVSVLGSTGNISLAAASSLSLSQNGSTVSLGLASNITTALQSAGAYLTTAAQSGHSHGNPALNLTNLSGTTASNSAGFTLSLSAAAPGAGGGAGLSAGTQSVSTGTINFANSNGISFGMSGSNQITASHNGLTTAAQSNHSHGNPALNLTNLSGTTASNSAGVTFSLSAAAPLGATAFSNSNNVSFGLNGSTVTATATFAQSVQSIGLYGGGANTTGGTSTTIDARSLSVFGYGGISAGISDGGLAISGVVPMRTTERGNYFYTSNNTFANSTHSHGNPVLNLTNLSGTTASGSAGLTISLSAAAPGGGGAINVSAGTTSGNLQTIEFANSNGVSFGLNGSTVTASAAGGAGSTLNRNMIEIIPGERLTTIMNLSASQFSRRPLFVPFWMDGQNLVPKTVRLLVSGVGSSNRSLVATFGVALYSKINDTQLTMFSSDSQALSYTASSQSSVWNGIKLMDFTGMSNVTMTQEGRWVLGTSFSASQHDATFANMLLYGADNMPNIGGYIMGGTTSASGASSAVFPFWGVYSTTTAGFPNTVAMTQILGGNSASLVDPYCIIKEV